MVCDKWNNANIRSLARSRPPDDVHFSTMALCEKHCMCLCAQFALQRRKILFPAAPVQEYRVLIASDFFLTKESIAFLSS